MIAEADEEDAAHQEEVVEHHAEEEVEEQKEAQRLSLYVSQTISLNSNLTSAGTPSSPRYLRRSWQGRHVSNQEPRPRRVCIR